VVTVILCVIIMVVVASLLFCYYIGGNSNTKVGTPSASHNTGSHAICPECNNSVSIKELKALSQCPHCKVDYPFVVRGKQQASA